MPCTSSTAGRSWSELGLVHTSDSGEKSVFRLHQLWKVARDAKVTMRSTAVLSLISAVLALIPGSALAQAPADTVLDSLQQRDVVQRMITVLRERYVFPDVAGRMADSLRADLEKGAYDGALEPTAFANMLSGRIRQISADGHLWVMYDHRPDSTVKSGPEDASTRRRRLARSNFGLPEAEVLPGNVGYLNIRQFVDPELAGRTAAAAMEFLADVDALILDVRESKGGSPGMVSLLASYLFGPEPVHLFDIYRHPQERTDQYWTLSHLGSERLMDQPVYVLTKSTTFSAGEGLAYILKHLDRATIVGERTAGGANPGGFHRLDDRFVMFVAEARVTSAITEDNWEGVGVAPDVAVSGDRALDEAYLRALEHLRGSERQGDWAGELEALIEEIRSRLHGDLESSP